MLAKFLNACNGEYKRKLSRHLELYESLGAVSKNQIQDLTTKIIELLKSIEEKRANNPNLILDLSCYGVLINLIKYPYKESPKDFFKWLFDYINKIYEENKTNQERLYLDEAFFQKMEDILNETLLKDGNKNNLSNPIKKLLNLHFAKNYYLRQWELIENRPSLLKLIDPNLINDIAEHFNSSSVLGTDGSQFTKIAEKHRVA